MTTPTRSIIDPEAENVVDAGNAQSLTNELAATSLAILDAENDRRAYLKEVNERIKKYKVRQRDLAQTIKAGGIQLTMNFGTVASDTAVVTPRRGRKAKGEESVQ